MKRILMFFTCLVLAIQCFSQSSEITIQIGDTAEISFLNKVENKLLTHIRKIQKREIAPDVNLFAHSPLDKTGHWGVLLTNNDVMKATLPERIGTNKYELSIFWNKNLDTSYVIGFSKMYYHVFFDNTGWFAPPGSVFCYPIYEIPWRQYKAFLKGKEMNTLYRIISQEWTEYITDTRFMFNHIPCLKIISDAPSSCFPCIDSVSERIVDINKEDSILPSFSLDFWMSKLKTMMKSGEISVYKDSLCTVPMTKWQLENKVLDEVDSTLRDENGNPLPPLTSPCPLKYLAVSERWKFDTNRKYLFNMACMTITRKILSVGIYTVNRDNYGNEVHYGTAWIKYSDVEKSPDLNEGKMALYKEILDAPLFKKLNVAYPKY